MKKRNSKPSTTTRKKRKSYRPPGSVKFTSARGKTVEQVYVTAYEDVNCVTLCFTDKTELVVDVEPCVAFSADYSDWTHRHQRVLKRLASRAQPMTPSPEGGSRAPSCLRR